MELKNYSQKLTSLNKDDLFTNPDEVKTKGLILTSIALVITVGSLAASQVGLITNTYKIEAFYKTDVLEANTEYILYCKTFSQIADLVLARGKIASNATSIIFSLAGAGKAVTVYEILGTAEKIGKKALMDRIIAVAVHEWGVIVDDIIDQKLVVKVIPFEKKNRFSDVKNLFAVFEIIYDSDECENFINDVPLEVNEFLNQEFIEILQDRGLEIHKGFNPPDVTGNYYVDSWTNKETDLQYINYSYQFTNQTPNFQIEVNSESDRAVAFGTGAFISGDGDNFSIYYETDSHISEDDHVVYIKSADIYTGSISENGIINFEKGFIILEKENDSFYSKTNSQGFKLHFLGSGFLGELEIQDQFFAYSPETESLPGLYGILGMNFLSQLKRITYHPQRHLIIMNDTNELAGITLPISKNGSPFYLTIQNTEGAVWLFDTGNYGLSALNSSLAKQLDIAKSLEKWEGNSHRFLWEDVNIQINYWYMPSYFLGEINLKNMLLRGFEVPENASWPGDWNPVRDLKGVLSNRLMLERSFQIDFNKELVRISGVPVFDEFHHQILRSFYVYGISVGIDFSRDEFVIHGIMQSSSLYKAGVRLGDRIPIAQLMDEGGRWRKILNDTGDYSYLSNSFFLDVVRGDQVLKIELQLELPFRVWLGR